MSFIRLKGQIFDLENGTKPQNIQKSLEQYSFLRFIELWFSDWGC